MTEFLHPDCPDRAPAAAVPDLPEPRNRALLVVFGVWYEFA
jgi:hypothetical protein